MIELPVLIENIIEIVNVAIEMMLVFLYFSLLSKAKVNKAVLYLSYLLSTVILSATVLLTDNILVYLLRNYRSHISFKRICLLRIGDTNDNLYRNQFVVETIFCTVETYISDKF